MNGGERIVRIYLTRADRSPFEEWFDGLSDERARDRILARIARLRLGNPGDWKKVGSGVFEMRIDYGPGYRLYFGQEGSQMVILLIGGDKSTQARDIKRAKEYWHEYKQNKEAKEF
jgi:putative addiction module killer protein